MEEKQYKPSEEIDLLYFLRPISNLGKKTWELTKNYVNLLNINKLFFFLVVFFITLGAFCLRYIIPRSFETQGVFISHFLPPSYFSSLSENLSTMKEGWNYESMASQLEISPQLAANIFSITLVPEQDTFLLKQKDTTSSMFTLKLRLGSMEYLDSIQNGFVNYFEHNQYAVKRKQAKIKSLTALKTSYLEKIESLDSLKKIVNNSITPRSQGQGIILGEPVDPVSVYKAQMEYYASLLKVDEELSLINNIEVVQPLIKLNKYNFPHVNWIVIYSFLISVLAALILIPIFGKKLQ